MVPDTEYRQSVPGIIGTNVLRYCNNNSDSLNDPYNIALNAMKCSMIAVKATNKKPLTIHPNEIITISGLVRKKDDSVTTAVTESHNKPQLAGLNICPRVVSLEAEGKTVRVPVRVCNIT